DSEHPLARNVKVKVPLAAEIAGPLGPQEQPSSRRSIELGLREDPGDETMRVRAVGERGYGRLVPQRSIALAADPRDVLFFRPVDLLAGGRPSIDHHAPSSRPSI